MVKLGADFDGDDIVQERDKPRLTRRLSLIYNYMKDGCWCDVREVAGYLAANGMWSSETSVSANIRNLRKDKFGGYTVERVHIAGGYYRYRLVV